MVIASLCLVHRSTRLSVDPHVSPARVWSLLHYVLSIGPHVCLSILMFFCPGVTVLKLLLSSDLFLLHDFSNEWEVEEQRHRLHVSLFRLTAMS